MRAKPLLLALPAISLTGCIEFNTTIATCDLNPCTPAAADTLTFTKSYDTNGDGTANSIHTYVYDQKGRELSSRLDYDADGISNYTEQKTYDAKDRVTSKQVDHDGDGNWDSAETSQWNAQDKLAFTTRDYDGDGTIDNTINRTYDARGNQIEYRSISNGVLSRVETKQFDTNDCELSYHVDSDGDGALDNYRTYTRDANCQVLTEHRYDDADNLIYHTLITYDVNGNQLTHQSDSNGDGTWDSSSSAAYDANNNRILEESDNDADGNIDSRTTFLYDANSNQLSIIGDRNADGNAEYETYFTWSADGRVTSRRSLTDGLLDRAETHQYDAAGNQIRNEQDNNGDGNIDRIETWVFDAQNNTLRWERDTNADGTVDQITAFTYDSQGNQTTHIEDRNGDGTPDRITTTTYDSQNNLIYYSEDTNGDGTPETESFSTFNNRNQQLSSTVSYTDPTNNLHRIYHYNDKGLLIADEADLQNDGSINFARSYQYTGDLGIAPLIAFPLD